MQVTLSTFFLEAILGASGAVVVVRGTIFGAWEAALGGLRGHPGGYLADLGGPLMAKIIDGASGQNNIHRKE